VTSRGIPLGYGEATLDVVLPEGVDVRIVAPRPLAPAPEPLAVVADALDRPLGLPPLAEAARGVRDVAIVVPDGTRPSAADAYLLPVIARLARAGLGPGAIRLVVARGIHRAMERAAVERIVGREVMAALKVVQSAPDSPEMNETVGRDPEVGEVRLHRAVATAGLVLLTGAVQPHHQAGFSGGAKALVPGVAERATVLAAHRLTLDATVAPDGSVRSAAGTLDRNAFREALLRIARAHGRAYALQVVLGDGGGIAVARAGEVGEAHEAAARAWLAARAPAPPNPDADLVLVGGGLPGDGDLVQAHKALLAGARHARPGAPIVWLAAAPRGPGHPDFLPWFEVKGLPRHLAALRSRFQPYGLTAYSVRWIAHRHPVHVVSGESPDVLRPMGLLPFATVDAALAHALSHHEVRRVVALP
jgi:nickel-dependent lactate racemase